MAKIKMIFPNISKYKGYRLDILDYLNESFYVWPHLSGEWSEPQIERSLIDIKGTFSDEPVTEFLILEFKE